MTDTKSVVTVSAAMSRKPLFTVSAAMSRKPLFTASAAMSGTALVTDNAARSGTALVTDSAAMTGTALVTASAAVSGTALVTDSEAMSGTALVTDSTAIFGTALVTDSTAKFGKAFDAESCAHDPSRIPLQWFAAEDEGRTEEPSEYKLRKAREEGRVAKSQELISAAGLLLPALVMVFLGSYFAKTMREMLVYYLAMVGHVDVTVEGMALARSMLGYFLRLTLPVLAAGVIAAIASNFFQVGALFTVKPITPNFSRIVPHFGQYLRKTLFSIDGAYNFLRSIVKLFAIGFVSYFIITAELEKLITLNETSLVQAVTFIISLALRIIIVNALILLALSVPDLMFQRRRHKESLKMSMQEVKEERKMHEGDPMVRSRIRERMREILSRNMAANVPKADVVITNPTHFAVALEWDREKMQAPMVSAKGMDEMALRIRKIAEEAGVPLVENKPLARALFAEVEIGESIPEKYYEVIASVLAHVYGEADKASRLAAAGF